MEYTGIGSMIQFFMRRPALIVSLLVVTCLIGGVLTASTVAKLSLYQEEDSPLRLVAKVAKLSECRLEPLAAEATAEPVSFPPIESDVVLEAVAFWPPSEEPLVLPLERAFPPSSLRAPPQLF
jgi:hypothetical protein